MIPTCELLFGPNCGRANRTLKFNCTKNAFRLNYQMLELSSEELPTRGLAVLIMNVEEMANGAKKCLQNLA